MLETFATILIVCESTPSTNFDDLRRWFAFWPEDDEDVTTLAGFIVVWDEWEAQIDEWVDAWDDGDRGSHDLSDEAYALASAGWGTDEDYGHYGGDEW
jgi:hypothetical protein